MGVCSRRMDSLIASKPDTVAAFATGRGTASAGGRTITVVETVTVSGSSSPRRLRLRSSAPPGEIHSHAASFASRPLVQLLRLP